jgi:hypothetical protein
LYTVVVASSQQLREKSNPNISTWFFSRESYWADQEPDMKTLFDILKKDRKGTFVWLEAVNDMDEARTRLRQLSEQSKDEFVVFRNTDLQVVATSREEDPGKVNEQMR